MTAGWEPPQWLETRVSVLTWNIWWRFGPWEARQPAILATLRRADADIVCLQEVWETRADGNQAAQLADELGMHHAYGTGLSLDTFEQGLGNAILSRWPITGMEARPLPAPEGLDELRVVLRADVDGPRGPLEVFTTHLNWRMDQSHVRQDQVRAVCELVAETAERRERPPIVCGDFNAEPESDEIRMMTGLKAIPVAKLMFFDAWRSAGDGGPGWTWSTENPFTSVDPDPDRRIDYVFSGYPNEDDGAGHVVTARVEGNERVDGIYPSDHFGVYAELRY